MPAKLIEGRRIADEVRAGVRARAAAFERRAGRPPGLTVVLVGDDPASQVYVKSKERASDEVGIRGEVIRLPATTAQADLNAVIDRLNTDDGVDGILVQLPLPSGLDAAQIVARLSPAKDVDGLTAASASHLYAGTPGLRPCTPLGCMKLLAACAISVAGAHAVVIGRSNLVGKPLGLLLLHAHASVTWLHSKSRDPQALARSADILIAAAGQPKLVDADWVKPGAVVLDVGIHRLPSGELCGDVDFASVREHASWLTPVPGGVGPMTIAMLLSNTVDAAELRFSQRPSQS